MEQISSQQFPFVSCLCPTYRRRDLLANSLACFLAQDYPADRREMIILDDAGDYQHQTEPGWTLVSVPLRFRSLPEKFNALAGLARGDVLVVWEDDDIYLPWHLSAHVAALTGGEYSKPSEVQSLYTGKLAAENAAGRFHGSIAFTRAALDASGGWPLTRRGDFDQQFLARLNGVARMVDPCRMFLPSYVFRWTSTGAYHGQALMRGPHDETWYEDVRSFYAPQSCDRPLQAKFDPETELILASCTSCTEAVKSA